MSQSDYIRFKRSANILKNSKELPPVLEPSSYTAFETYNLETTVTNTKNSYSRLLPTTDKYFFEIEKNVSNCATFPLCVNTNTRANRVLNTAEKIVLSNGTRIPYTPAATYRFNKMYIPTTCTFTNGAISRRVPCSKTICKCKTRVI
jgi:hypothetical protein